MHSGFMFARLRARLLLAVAGPLILLATLLMATRSPAASAAEPLAPAAGAFAAIADGGEHTCALTAGGAVQCWGNNTSGELGDGTTTARLLPVDVAGLGGSASAIAAGTSFTCAIVNGGAQCWGANGWGQLGNGSSMVSSTVPVSVSGLSSGVSAISAGAGYACAVVNGAARCWGANTSGELGITGTLMSNVPVTVTGLNSGVTAVAAGTSLTCAVVNGGAKCWGLNGIGQLGNGSFSNSSTPVNVSGLSSGVTAIAVGHIHACALVNAVAVCWGSNLYGELGANSTAVSSTTPIAVSGLVSGVTTIAVGFSHTCALVGFMYCWGNNYYGQLGDGTTLQRRAPVSVSGLGAGVSAIATGAQHSCALMNGSAWCWGYNRTGQLGDGTITNRYLPVPVGTVAALVGEGRGHACAIKNGGVKCWGSNFEGQLGNGSARDSDIPVEVAGLSSGASAVAAGGDYACALASGAVRCWGDNFAGQLGIGSHSNTTVPVTVSGLFSGVTAIAAGSEHTCALVRANLECWGSNEFGQLGVPGPFVGDSPVPTAVVGLGSGVSAIAAGDFHTCAVVNGGAKCWGENSWGQLGDGTRNQSSAPVAVVGLGSGVIALAAGGSHSCALLLAGTIQCWGHNDAGQLGNNSSAISSTVPVAVVGLSGPAGGVAAGSAHSCAVLISGGAACWGANAFGQLGDTTYVSRSVAAAVYGLSGIMFLGTSRDDFACAVTQGSGVLCWGGNFDGVLGPDAPGATSPVPVNIAGLCDCARPTCCIVNLAYGCPAPTIVAALSPFEALGAAAAPFDIRTYFAMRGRVLAGTSRGRHYIDLYNSHNPDIRTALLTHPALWGEGLSLLQQWQPMLQALVDGQGNSITITTGQVQAVKTFLNDLSANGSPALQQTIAAELASTPLDPLAGKTVEQARGTLVGYPPLYLPLIQR